MGPTPSQILSVRSAQSFVVLLLGWAPRCLIGCSLLSPASRSHPLLSLSPRVWRVVSGGGAGRLHSPTVANPTSSHRRSALSPCWWRGAGGCECRWALVKVGVRSEPPLLVAILTSQRNRHSHRAGGELSAELVLVGSGEKRKGKDGAFAPIGSRLAGPLTVLVASGRCWSGSLRVTVPRDPQVSFSSVGGISSALSL